jgi:hypothetical protein
LSEISTAGLFSGLLLRHVYQGVIVLQISDLDCTNDCGTDAGQKKAAIVADIQHLLTIFCEAF